MNRKYNVPSIQHCFKILQLISEEEKSLTLGEISKKINIPKTTIFRILITLENEGIIEKNDDKIKIGYRLIKLGLKSVSKLNIRNIAFPIMNDLSINMQKTVQLAVLSEKKSLLIEVCDSSDHLRISSKAGTSVDLHCSATGKVLLAYIVREDELESFFHGLVFEKRTKNTIINIDNLKKELVIVREQGYAIDNEEYYDGIKCFAAPIFDAFGDVVAAIGFTTTKNDLKDENLNDYAKKVLKAANLISKKLGA